MTNQKLKAVKTKFNYNIKMKKFKYLTGCDYWVH
jgi:hypothetical protein